MKKVIVKIMESKDCKYQSHDLQIHVKTRNKVKFKAGAELSGQVNIVQASFEEENTDNSHQYRFNLRLCR